MNKILQGDCLEVLKTLEDNSVDSIVTDPPYGLSFMGKKWDYDVPSADVWKECFRVLKPGGHLLSFAGTRTYHRMAVNVEDAGFEIRDMISWLYGSGFPKSLNIGKAIDKLQGNERDIIGYQEREGRSSGILGKKVQITRELSKGNSEWEGWGTALKPACEPIVVARKPLSEKNVALNVLKWGTGGINIDESRVGKNPGWSYPQGAGGNTFHGQKRRIEPETSKGGRFPANIILECTCDKIEQGQEKISGGFGAMDIGMSDTGKGKTQNYDKTKTKSKENKFMIHTDPNCPCYMLDEQSGVCKPQGNKLGKSIDTKGKNSFFGGGQVNDLNNYKDKGGASRFFYCAKSSKAERNAGCEGLKEKQSNPNFGSGGFSRPTNQPERETKPTTNHHPTVKPIKLMEYLVRLVTPKEGVCLDPFIGSGTTAIACKRLGFKYLGIEREEEYIKIAEARLSAIKERQVKLNE